MSIIKQEQKQQRRKYFRQLRKNIPELQRTNFSQKITKSLSILLQKNTQNISSGYIALFAGTREEPNILELISLFPDQKFCFPKIIREREMEFFSVNTLHDFEKGKFGILEPKKHCQKVSHLDIKMFCIPALAIDKKGIRLGMGGGFYDTYLSKISKEVLKIGIIFSCQLSNTSFLKISEKFDIPVDIIITEKEEVSF